MSAITKITALRVQDARFPTSKALAYLVVGHLAWISAEVGRFWRYLTSDSPLRWIGPDKGAMHLVIGAVVNAVWRLRAKAAGKPVWQLIADMSPKERARCIDFRYLRNCIASDEALSLLREQAPEQAGRIRQLEQNGNPCDTASAGWLGYSDAKLHRLSQKAVEDGFQPSKLKVGGNLAEDLRRARIVREVSGPDRHLMVDANHVWEVDQSIDWVNALAFAKPWCIEEPTSPDDVEGHRKIREGIGAIAG